MTGSAVVVFFLVHNCYVCQPANFGLRKPKSVTESCDILIGTSRQLQTDRGQCIEPTLMPFVYVDGIAFIDLPIDQATILLSFSQFEKLLLKPSFLSSPRSSCQSSGEIPLD